MHVKNSLTETNEKTATALTTDSRSRNYIEE